MMLEPCVDLDHFNSENFESSVNAAKRIWEVTEYPTDPAGLESLIKELDFRQATERRTELKRLLATPFF